MSVTSLHYGTQLSNNQTITNKTQNRSNKNTKQFKTIIYIVHF